MVNFSYYHLLEITKVGYNKNLFNLIFLKLNNNIYLLSLIHWLGVPRILTEPVVPPFAGSVRIAVTKPGFPLQTTI